MQYDLIVVGGGPAGLMAAKTAAEDGLKVVVLERKKRVTEVRRACSQVFYTSKITLVDDPTAENGRTHHDGYIEPVSVESFGAKTRFHFPVPGFSLDYEGPLRPYLNWIYISPSRYTINHHAWNDRPWGFYFNKERFLDGLLAAATQAGAEIILEAVGLSAENTESGVKVRLRAPSGERTLEARAVIAADGVESRIVESLGLNQNRNLVRESVPGAGFVHLIVEGAETGFPEASWLTWAIPSLNPFGSIMFGLTADNRHTVAAVGINPLSKIQDFMADPRYADIFSKATVVNKEAVAVERMRGPIREPVAGNVVVIGDAAAPIETWIQGAVACAYQAVKAIGKELNGQPGYADYTRWWQGAFAFNTPSYGGSVRLLYLLHQNCSDADFDYIYQRFHDYTGIPVMLVAKYIDLIKADRPELHAKLIAAGIRPDRQ
jgi:digeranylgeranylglycerophospholipid reductase